MLLNLNYGLLIEAGHTNQMISSIGTLSIYTADQKKGKHINTKRKPKMVLTMKKKNIEHRFMDYPLF